MEDGAPIEPKAAILGTVDLGAGEVRRQQVRGKLDAVEVPFQAGGQGLDGLGSEMAKGLVSGS
jgi:hypothetical protein